MKRIFLTSGLVLCMACPAFATASWNGQTGNTPALDDGCTQPNLGVYSGPTTLKALWDNNHYEIVLNSNLGNTTAEGGDTAAAPTPMYSVPGQAKVWTGINSQTGDLTGESNAGADIISTDATGIMVNYVYDYNLPNGHQTSEITPSSASTAAQRDFLGFFDSTSGSTQYVTASGALTQEGANAASAASANQTWYAQWDLATPTIGSDPDLTGYTFAGWNTQSNGSGSTPGAIGEDTTIYAQWTAHTGTLMYNCGDQPGTTTLSGSAPSQVSLTYDQPFAIATTPGSCVYEGYTFAGWECEYDLAAGTAGSTTYAATNGTITSGNTGTYHVAADGVQISCSATWTAKTIGTITWIDPDGGNTISGGSPNCTYDGSITLPTAPTRTGYQFAGWEVVPQGN